MVYKAGDKVVFVLNKENAEAMNDGCRVEFDPSKVFKDCLLPMEYTIQRFMDERIKPYLIEKKGNPFVLENENNFINLVLHLVSDSENGIRIIKEK